MQGVSDIGCLFTAISKGSIPPPPQQVQDFSRSQHNHTRKEGRTQKCWLSLWLERFFCLFLRVAFSKAEGIERHREQSIAMLGRTEQPRPVHTVLGTEPLQDELSKGVPAGTPGAGLPLGGWRQAAQVLSSPLSHYTKKPNADMESTDSWE